MPFIIARRGDHVGQVAQLSSFNRFGLEKGRIFTEGISLVFSGLSKRPEKAGSGILKE
jgi:hypothetical protein